MILRLRINNFGRRDIVSPENIQRGLQQIEVAPQRRQCSDRSRGPVSSSLSALQMDHACQSIVRYCCYFVHQTECVHDEKNEDPLGAVGATNPFALLFFGSGRGAGENAKSKGGKHPRCRRIGLGSQPRSQGFTSSSKYQFAFPAAPAGGHAPAARAAFALASRPSATALAPSNALSNALLIDSADSMPPCGSRSGRSALVGKR